MWTLASGVVSVVTPPAPYFMTRYDFNLVHGHCGKFDIDFVCSGPMDCCCRIIFFKLAWFGSVQSGSASAFVLSKLVLYNQRRCCVTCALKEWTASTYDPDAAERARSLAFEEGSGCREAEVMARRCRQMLDRI
jgi:hypothetical protein